jgi:hypothetical protein
MKVEDGIHWDTRPPGTRKIVAGGESRRWRTIFTETADLQV